MLCVEVPYFSLNSFVDSEDLQTTSFSCMVSIFEGLHPSASVEKGTVAGIVVEVISLATPPILGNGRFRIMYLLIGPRFSSESLDMSMTILRW